MISILAKTRQRMISICIFDEDAVRRFLGAAEEQVIDEPTPMEAQ